MENLKMPPGVVCMEAGRQEMAAFLSEKPEARVIRGRLEDLGWSLRSFGLDVAGQSAVVQEMAREMLLGSGALAALVEGQPESQGWQYQAHASAWVQLQLLHARAKLPEGVPAKVFSFLHMGQFQALAGWLAEQPFSQLGAVFTVWAVVQRLITEAEHLEDGEIEGALHELLDAFENPAPAAEPPLSLSLN